MSRRPASTREQVEVRSRGELRTWLEVNHLRSEGIWLVTYKTGRPEHVPYNEVVEEALAFGWIDSLPRLLDHYRSMLVLAPRKPGSAWSKVNKKRADRLTSAGCMTEAGVSKVERAKADGSWSKLDEVEALTVPSDLQSALTTRPGALENFEAFPRSVRRAILEWILEARRPETRAARVEDTADKAERNERANQWRSAGRAERS